MTMTPEQQKQLKTLSNWLFFCCGTIFAMMIIGAITRLTESGLSMVEWRPLIGALPPLNEAEWVRVFTLYQETPEYQKINFGMTLAEFKNIFFWEWFHRLWGRLIGLVYALPFAYFLLRKWIPAGYKLKLFGLLILGGLQGVMGWYMVKSGLIDQPAVSHYRLAAHLSLAFILYMCLLWLGLSLRQLAAGKTALTPVKSGLYTHGIVTLFFLALTIVWGAYVAGLDAGLVYTDTFPKMGATWIPEEVFFYDPMWKNFFNNHAGVQFAHRWLAMITAVIVISFALHAAKKGFTNIRIAALGLMVILQVGLGIATLMSNVHLHIATAHQAGAILLFTFLIMSLHKIRHVHAS